MQAQEETFRIAADQSAARCNAYRLFEILEPELARILPPTAEIHHIGATSVPECLTKGDLDIAIRVVPADFIEAEALLAKRFSRNLGSVLTETFAAFEDRESTPHLGIQLTVKGGTFDVFHRFADALRSNSDIVRQYNDLKRTYHGKPMAEYRAAKNNFIAIVLRS